MGLLGIEPLPCRISSTGQLGAAEVFLAGRVKSCFEMLVNRFLVLDRVSSSLCCSSLLDFFFRAQAGTHAQQAQLAKKRCFCL